MKRLLLLLVVLLLPMFGYATACPTGYSNIYTWTIPAQSTLAANVSNAVVTFPGNAALVGVVQSATGVDLVPCPASSSGTVMSYFRVPSSWNSSTGAIEMKIVIPTVSTSASETIYFVAGNADPTDYSSGSGVCTAASLLSAHSFGTSSTLDLTDWCGTIATNYSVTAVAGEVNGGAAFASASSQYIDAGASFSATSSSHIGVEVWVKPTSLLACQRVLSNLTGSSYNGYELYLGSGCGANGTAVWQAGTSGTLSTAATGSAISAGNWSMLAASSNGTGAGALQMYLNGAASGSSGTSSGIGTSSVNLNIGRWPGSASNYFNGAEDEAIIYNFTPSASQFKLDYLSQSNPSGFGTFSSLSATTPTFSPSSGAPPQTVTISTATSGCGSYIYWSTTNNPPTISDTNGTSISVATPETVYAKVIGCPGYTDSGVGNANYSAGGWVASGISLFMP